MGDRFYMAQLKATGNCPGAPLSKQRRKKVAWTEEKRQEVIDAYTKAEPTPENSMEIVTQIAQDMDETVNGVRAILSKAGVYVRKAPAASASGKSNGNGGSKRVSKEDAQNQLKDALSDAGVEVDEDIVSKLTGKAAVYFAGVVSKLAS